MSEWITENAIALFGWIFAALFAWAYLKTQSLLDDKRVELMVKEEMWRRHGAIIKMCGKETKDE